MKKYIVLSVNENIDYLFFTPITVWTWKQFGWETILFHHGQKGYSPASQLALTYAQPSKLCLLDDQDCRSDTLTQMSRLYAGVIVDPEDYLMTGDIDMLALSDFWKPDFNAKTVWGWDLTGKGHFPCCYIGMKAKAWCEVMNLYPRDYNTCIERDLKVLPQAKSEDFYKRWFLDQDLITERLRPYNPVHVLRGQYANGLAVGRIDRANWSLSHSTFIDAHLHHQIFHKGREEYFNKTMKLLYEMWPEEDFTWFMKYTDEFRKLTGHA